MRKFVENCEVISNRTVAENIFLLKVRSENIPRNSSPGQFCEILIDSVKPFLRRPFSISDAGNDWLEFMIEVVGSGTEYLSQKKAGDTVNIIGPLGNGFNIKGKFDIAIIVAGGIGIAPFPFLSKKLFQSGRDVLRVAGFSTKKKIPKTIGNEYVISTDDGSKDFHGNVVMLLEHLLMATIYLKTKAFACGPMPMLREVKKFFEKKNVELEVSVETDMACGIGLCQGCVIENAENKGYSLVCKDGPVFDAKKIVL